MWLEPSIHWTAADPRYRSSAWATKGQASKFDCQNVFLRPPTVPWHSGGKSPENPVPGRNQWIVVDFGGPVDLSVVRMTPPKRGKGEWDGSEIQNFELQTAPKLEGPWTAVVVGKGKKIKTPQDFPCECTTRFFRLFAKDEYGYKFITLATLDFKGFMKFDPKDGANEVPITFPPPEKTGGKKKYNDKKGGGGGRDRKGGKGGGGYKGGRRDDMNLHDMTADTGRPKEVLQKLLDPLEAGATNEVYLNDLLPYEREIMKEIAWELGFLTEVLTIMPGGAAGGEGAAAAAAAGEGAGGAGGAGRRRRRRAVAARRRRRSCRRARRKTQAIAWRRRTSVCSARPAAARGCCRRATRWSPSASRC